MPIDMKISTGWVRTAQPYVKLSPDQWTPLKRALVKTLDGWKEIWPSEFVYIHTGYGYNMNIHACFGYPTAAGRYTFINRGFIGGSVTAGGLNVALDTGTFPAGSEVTLINEGYISGTGGRGSYFTGWEAPGNAMMPLPGGDALRLRYPVFIDNNLGVIQAGGGGGGASGDFAGSTYHRQGGGGGAGLPGGASSGQQSAPGTLTAGGNVGYGGNGGAPGGAGAFGTVVNNDYDIRTTPAGPGIAIKGAEYILAGSIGIDAVKVKGRKITGPVSVQFSHFGSGVNTHVGSGNGNWGASLAVNVTVSGASPVVTAARIGGSSSVTITKVSATMFLAKHTGSGSGYDRSPQTFATGIFRFTVNSPQGSDYFDMPITCGEKISPREPRSCFIAGSMITMADGTYKAIEDIMVGEVVRTAVGVSVVSGIDLPILGDRPLYEFADGKCATSGEHSMWSRKPDTNEQWWATRDMKQWIIEALSGDGPNFDVKPYDLTEMEGTEWEFATETGWVRTAWKRVEAPEDTQLYHLLLEEGGSYYVDGYLVSSMADSGGVDWHTFVHE